MNNNNNSPIFLSSFQGVQGETGDRDLMYSDDDEDFSSPEEGSDSEPMLDEISATRPAFRKSRSRVGERGLGSGKLGGSSAAAQARQRNLKQKFVALLKKFKVTDPEDLHEQVSLDQKLSGKSLLPTSQRIIVEHVRLFVFWFSSTCCCWFQ